MQKSTLCALSLCALLAVSGLGILSGCDASDAPAVTASSADVLETYFDEHPKLAKRLSSCFSGAELSALAPEDGMPAATLTAKKKQTVTTKFYTTLEREAEAAEPLLSDVLTDLEKTTGQAPLKLTLHYCNPDGTKLAEIQADTEMALVLRLTEAKDAEPAKTPAAAITEEDRYDSIAALLESDLLKPTVDSLQSDACKLTLKAKKNVLLLRFRYQKNMDAEILSDVLQQELEEMDFSNILEIMETYTTVKQPKLVVRYLNRDGTVLAEKTFPA